MVEYGRLVRRERPLRGGSRMNKRNATNRA